MRGGSDAEAIHLNELNIHLHIRKLNLPDNKGYPFFCPLLSCQITLVFLLEQTNSCWRLPMKERLQGAEELRKGNRRRRVLYCFRLEIVLMIKVHMCLGVYPFFRTNRLVCLAGYIRCSFFFFFFTKKNIYISRGTWP